MKNSFTYFASVSILIITKLSFRLESSTAHEILKEYSLFTHFFHSHQFHKILLIQFGTPRDTIRTLPIINILRLRYPNARIAWLASQEMIEFLNSYNIVDHLVLAKPGWYKRLFEINTLRKRLQAYASDLCLDLQGDMASGLAMRLSGNSKRISISGTRNRCFIKAKKQRQVEHQPSKYLQLFETPH